MEKLLDCVQPIQCKSHQDYLIIKTNNMIENVNELLKIGVRKIHSSFLTDEIVNLYEKNKWKVYFKSEDNTYLFVEND